MTTDTKDTEQARKALHKAEKEYCSNFDKGPVFLWADKGTVFHWAERGAYMLKADAQAEIARLREERDRFEAALGRACQVGGTTYLVERAEKAEAERDEARTDLGRIIMSLPTGKGERAAGAVEGVKMMRARLEAERDAALAQVAAAITGNKSGTICRDCRGVGMIHCSDPFNYGGMQPYTVEELKSVLSRRDAQMRAEGRKEGMREAAGMVSQWCKADELLLRAGEMTAQELRTAKAVAGGIERTILAAAEKEASP